MDTVNAQMWGSPGQIKKFDTLRPEQLQMLMQLLQQLAPAQQSGLNRLQDMLQPGGGKAGDAFAQPYMRQFNEQTVPGIAERFGGMGSHGALSSSGFQQSLGSAGTRLQEQLAALREGLGQQALGMLPGFQQQGMQSAFGNVYEQPQAGIFPGMIGGAVGGFGQGMGKSFAASMMK